MQLFADANIVRAAVLRLRDLGHDVVWAGDRDHDPGDVALLAEANTARRVFITKDHDMGRLVFQDRAEHAGVLLIDDLRAPDAETELIVATLNAYGVPLSAGAFIRANASGVRLVQPNSS
jgi:predicted nuclease of predicted toxin-antitoxin system